MKHYNILKNIFLLILLSGNYISFSQPFTPIVVNNTPVIGACTLGSYGTVAINVPTEALTGDNIPLNINLPATATNCIKTVTITSSANLNFVSSVIPFSGGGTIYTNAGVLDPINGQNFNVFYRFAGGVTCNNAQGSLTVKVELNCNGNIITCERTVNVRARAGNYWTVSKQFLTGNLTCGNSYWRINVIHSNPNGAGLGAYTLNGTITENATVPVISPASAISVNATHLFNGNYQYNVVLENCRPQGSTITNTANYNFVLGNSCGTMINSVQATSPALQSPNASISFTKSAYANGGVFSPGCQGVYSICVYNNGNTPWTNFTLNDNLTIPGITVTSVSLGAGWSGSSATSGPVSYTNTGVLNPGEQTCIYIYFTVTGAPTTTVTNTAYLSYAGGGGSNPGPTSTGCPGINCPIINTSIQNKTAPNNFTISQPVAIPKIVKCNEPYTLSPPIKQVGGTIKFRILVGNSGAANLTTTITDALNTASQNLIIVGTPTYTYYTNQYIYTDWCTIGGGTTTNICTWNNNTTNPVFNVNALPGNCNLDRANVLVIEFEATINPQLSGSKTNTATMGSLSANANYTIDKFGSLMIRKKADVQTVENGAGFNYIITVTNVGSHPLNTVVVTDNLPTCVARNGNISVKRGTTVISSSVTGNIVLNINPVEIINPGESFVITVPVRKLGGTSCCNESASATSKMVIDGYLVPANTPINEPACVVSTLCCDIPHLQMGLNPVLSWRTGAFNLNINAGATPIQEMEVSVIDYHVQYSSSECKPSNMGIFGNVFSPNVNVGGLVLNGNGSHSLTWLPGSPVLLNHTIRLSISKPSILGLSCCNGIVYFCLKVRIKDVNCRVCEKIVCGSFNIKDNIIIINPPNDWPHLQAIPVRPDLKVQYEKMLMEQQQQNEIEIFQRQLQIEKMLEKIEPAKKEEFMKQLNSNGTGKGEPLQIILEGGPLSVPTGGTTPVPKPKN